MKHVHSPLGDSKLRRVSRFLVALIATVAVAWSPAESRSLASDWPTYRGDAGRSGSTADTLPSELMLNWQRTAVHAPQPAWSGRDTRMPFDQAYHTVIADGMLFFGSSADCRIYALDAATGTEKWSFCTDGPVRLTPAVADGRVFVGGDDGFLYCLAADDGHLLWKLRGGPTQSRVLGNGRMISRWPVRGGPVVAEGVVYFAAGIWPSEGIYICAVEAASGKVIWCNDNSGTIEMPQPHGGAVAKSGVSAHGNLVISGDVLLVPTGRAVPAAFSLSDGRLLYFHLQRNVKYGGSEVTAGAGRFFNSGCMFDLAAGDQDKTVKAVYPWSSAITPAGIVNWRKGNVEALGPPGAKLEEAWSAAVSYGGASLIAAGDSIVSGGKTEDKNGVALLDLGSKKVTWSTEVDGLPLGLAVADKCLFVSTDQGTIYCFTAKRKRDPGPVSTPKKPSYPAGGPHAAAADEIVRTSGVTEGYCLDLGCGDGSLAFALAKRTNLMIYAVDPDPENVSQARSKLAAAGLYGVRVTVHQGDPANSHHPDFFANLVVSAHSLNNPVEKGVRSEIARCLRPYGGVACTGKPGQMKKIVRGELKGAGNWTHQYCTPANNNCSSDNLAAGPLGVLWFEDWGFEMPSRHGRGHAPLLLDGRMFVEGMNGLLSVDAYNGRKLWEYPLPAILEEYSADHIMGTSGTGSNFCVTDDSVYVRVKGKCLRIDPASGKLLAEFEAPRQPDGKPGTWGVVACVGDTLFGSLDNTGHVIKWAWKPAEMGTQFTESSLFFAMDRTSGQVKWTFTPKHSIRHNTIAIGLGKVFLIDRPLAMSDRLAKEAEERRGKPALKQRHPPGTLVSLDVATGNVAWKSAQNIVGTLLALSEQHDVLLVTYQDTRFKISSEVGGKMSAYRATDGRLLWDIEAEYGSRPILNDRTIYAQPGAWDLLTGEEKDFEFSRSYGCGTLAGSTNMLVYRSATLGYTDLSVNRGNENYGGIRPGCWINTLPAGGLVLMPDATDRCTCSYLIKSSIALQPYGLRAPAVTPAGGAFPKPVRVEISGESVGAEIRYTLDGSSPTPNSPKYTGPIEISEHATLMARAYEKGMPPSPVSEAEFTIDPDIIPLADPGWSTYDSPGANPPESEWLLTEDYVTELSNLSLGKADDANPETPLPGSFRIWRPGKQFSDGELSLEISTSDNDLLGVAFRFQGPDKHYLWAMDRQRGFHVLALNDGEDCRVLAKNKQVYQPNRWYQLRVVLDGPKIQVYVDGQLDLEATDDGLAKGTLALYSWGCAGAKFRNVRIKD